VTFFSVIYKIFIKLEQQYLQQKEQGQGLFILQS